MISAASIYPAYVGLVKQNEATEKLINSLMLKYGISASVNNEFVKGHQWDYPNIWAPLQYIAYAACNNCGLEETAKIICKKYISLIDESYKNTGNLWEKYNGITGEPACQEYNAPVMLGWTAGVYLCLKQNENYLSVFQ